ncbi:MAG TPA: putative metallopeptidase [Bacteroidales bacterium]|nr:putative metallopeptidase [Bacteroidales bacterium]
MAIRYETMDTQTENFIKSTINSFFPYLRNAVFELAFDTKKRKSGGRYVISKIEKPNEVLRFVSSNEENPEGIDYVLILDKNVWNELSDNDKTRVVRHVLQHTDVDFEKDMPYGLRKPEVSTFYSEIEYNKDDPEWMERLETIADSLYTREDENE